MVDFALGQEHDKTYAKWLTLLLPHHAIYSICLFMKLICASSETTMDKTVGMKLLSEQEYIYTVQDYKSSRVLEVRATATQGPSNLFKFINQFFYLDIALFQKINFQVLGMEKVQRLDRFCCK